MYSNFSNNATFKHHKWNKCFRSDRFVPKFNKEINVYKNISEAKK